MKTKKDFTKLTKKTAKNKTTAKADKDKIKHLTRLIKLMIILDNGALNLDRAAEECAVIQAHYPAGCGNFTSGGRVIIQT